MGELGKIILVILLSSVKFVAGPPFAYYDQRYDFTFFETVFYCVVGGMLGVFAFTYFSRPLFKIWSKIIKAVKDRFRKKQVFSEPMADVENDLEIKYEYVEKDQKPRLFTKRNRKIITVWRKYGLVGIAFLTPVFLSIPIGTLIANTLVNSRKKIIVYMFFSLVFWSLLLTSMFEIFHAASVRDLQEQINK